MFLKKLLRKIIALALIVGLGWGCWTLYNAKKDKQEKTDKAFSEAYIALIDEMNKTEGRDQKALLEHNAEAQALYLLSSYYKEQEEPTEMTQLMKKLDAATTAMTGDGGALLKLKGYEKLSALKEKFNEKTAKAALDAIGFDIETE